MGGGASAAAPALLFPCVFAAGKALGGVLCDAIGYRRTILAVFLLGAAALQIPGLTGAVLLALAFNMTMPLTLRLAHRCAPRLPGLMFGLAAGCLLPGVWLYGFALPSQAMVTLQFLALAAAGWLIERGGGGPVEGRGR